MNKFKAGMRVQIIGCDNELLTGTIELLNDDIAIVRADNDTRYKRAIDEIAILKESEPVEAEQPEEPKEEATEKEVIVKEEITITQENFLESCAKVCARLHIEQGAGLAFMCSDFSALLVAELFIESPEK